MAGRKRIAICGFNLESNRFAPGCSRGDFEENMYFRGEEITEQARADYPSIHLGVCGFYKTMDAAYGGADGWEAAPAILIGSTPAGPVEAEFYDSFLDELRERLQAMMPLDGVYVCEHGAGIATHMHDPDLALFKLVREVVGEDAAVISTLDLHANVSPESVDLVDIFIGYRSNPHVDMYERGEETARLMLEMFDGVKPTSFRVQLPLVAPSVTQLTAEGHPYGDVIRFGQSKMDDRVMNVTILSGFAFGDTPQNGMAFIVTTRDDAAHAKALAIEIASAGWADHERYQTNMMPLEDATARALEVGKNASLPSLLFADPADNPGGGGRGNTSYILRAFLEAGVENCLLGVFYDRAAVAKANAAGEGAEIELVLNADEDNEFSEKLPVKAVVEKLTDGKFVGKHGMVAGKSVDLGASCLLKIGGIRVACITKRQQCLSPDHLASFGLDVEAARSVVVKSRGHFRAGFQHLFPAERTIEVDVPGLTSPNLANFNWRFLPRPVYPLDGEKARWDASMVE